MEYLTFGKSLSNFTPRQVRNVLTEIGVDVEGETFNDYLCLCPYHSNRDTPAMSVSKTKGTFCCFSPQCGEAGTLIKLMMDTASINEFAARRIIFKHSAVSEENFENDIRSILQEEPEYKPFDSGLIASLAENLWVYPGGLEYMHGRGFKDETLRHFDIGYSHKQRMVTVPVRTPRGDDMGFIARSIDSKDFMNTGGLQKSETLFNIHEARKNRIGYVTEASFDAMRVWQCGYPGAVAIAGGNISERQLYLLNMYFDTIVIMTDFDDKDSPSHKQKGFCKRCGGPNCRGHNPGRDLGNIIAKRLPSKNVMWATYDPGRLVYADGAKDVSDMTDEQIRQSIENAMPNFLYQQWAPY